MTVKVEFTLGIEYECYFDEMHLKFLEAISTLSGSPVDELRTVNISRGCVKITIEMNDHAFIKLMNAIDPRLSDNEPLAPDQVEAIEQLWNKLALQFFHSEKSTSKKDAHEFKNAPRKIRNNRIFFVHGWRGTSTSFGDLPQFLEEGTGCECKLFTYPTGFFERSASIAFLARALDNWVRNELEEIDSNFGIVAHSMGGIIVRDFLGSQLLRKQPLSDKVRHVSFIASPQAGSWLSKILQFVPSSATKQAADLDPNSQYLGHVNSTWNSWYPIQRHLHGHVRSFYATNDSVVDYVSAIGADPECIPILDSDHSSIIKPSDKNAEIVRTLKRLMREAELTHLPKDNPL